MRRKQNFQTISWFWDFYTRGLLDLDPPYQRKSVWNQAYRDYFIDTILLQYPSPAIFLFEEISPEGRSAYHVIDGKQRLLTMFGFIKNDFPVSDTAERASLRGQFFNQLSDEFKREFWSYQFSVEYIPTDEESVINNIFDRINRNTVRLTAQELRHARFGGRFITSAEELAESVRQQLPQDFPSIAVQSRNQMKDVELIALLLLLVEVGPHGYSTIQLDEEFSKRDTEWAEEIEVKENFRRIVQTIEELLNTSEGRALTSTRFKNQVDFYSLFGAIAELLNDGQKPPIEEWSHKLSMFIHAVEDEETRLQRDDTTQYYQAVRFSSTDVGARKTRIFIIKDVLSGNNYS